MKLLILLFVITFIILCSFVGADEIDDLIPFIIQVESGGNPHAVSNRGAIGLMQITPIVLKEWNKHLCFITYTDGTEVKWWEYNCNKPKDLFNVDTNIKIGEWYLRRLKDHYLKDNYTIERMLHAWNGGITRLRKLNYDCSKMPRETRNYVKKVMALYEKQ